MPKAQAVIADFQHGSLEVEQEILKDVATVEALDVHNESELWGRIEDADCIMVYHTLKVTKATIERLKHCQLIVRCGVGYDNVDHAFARTRGIPVANVPDYGTEEVADSAIGLMLALTRGINFHNNFLRAADADWRFHHVAPLYRLRGRSFAIIGLGRIGTAAAIRAKALGMDVVFYDPFKPDGYDKSLAIRRVETLADLLGQAFVVSVHCPRTPETTKLIGAKEMAQMPMGSFLINTARGAIVDTSAIPEALASGRLAGAGIDVLPEEPPAVDDPLIRAWRDPSHAAQHRLIVNPHAAFYSEEGLMDMRTKGADSC